MRDRASVLALAAGLLLLGGCGAARDGSAPTTSLDVVVPDAVLRSVGEPCAGGEPFLYVHATAPWRVENARGSTVARGALPEGRAVSILKQDPGVPRVPTTCRMRLRVSGLAGARYRLVLPQGRPLPFTPRAGRATVVLG